MKISINIISSTSIVDSYNYSLDGFMYNNAVLSIKNCEIELLRLISMASNWKDTMLDNIKDGVIVVVEVQNHIHRYVFDNSNLPDNFMSFMYEVKRLTKEV